VEKEKQCIDADFTMWRWFLIEESRRSQEAGFRHVQIIAVDGWAWLNTALYGYRLIKIELDTKSKE